MEVIFTDYFTTVSIEKLATEMPLNSKNKPYRIRFSNNTILIAKFLFCFEKNAACHLSAQNPEDPEYFSEQEKNEVILKLNAHVADQAPWVYYKQIALTNTDKLAIHQNTAVTTIENFGDHCYFYVTSNLNAITVLQNYLNNLISTNIVTMPISTLVFAEYYSDVSTALALSSKNVFYEYIMSAQILTNPEQPFVLDNVKNCIRWLGQSSVYAVISVNVYLTTSNSSENLALGIFINNTEKLRNTNRVASNTSTNNWTIAKTFVINTLDEIKIKLANLSNNTRTINISSMLIKINITN